MTIPVVSALRSTRNRMREVWRSQMAQAHAHFPGSSGIETVLLAAILGAIPAQHRILAILCTRAPGWRRLVGQRRLKGPARKILHVTCSFDLGGTQTQIRNLCEQTTDAWFVHDTVEIFPEQNYLYRRDHHIVPERYGGNWPLGRALRRAVAHMGVRSSQVMQIYKFARDFNALEPDVVIGWGHEVAMLTCAAAAFARVPHVMFCIRTFNPSFGWCTPEMGRLYHTSYQRMVPTLSGIIVNSTVLQRDYAEWLGIDPVLITPCPNGIDAKVASPDERAHHRRDVRERFGVPADSLLIVNVGRFSAEKGQFTILAANEQLLARYPDRRFQWLLCGDGALLATAKARVEGAGVRNVIFAGRTEEVPAILSAADIFVMASDFEGMPNAMMEAMAHGLPCVSTNRTGAIDIARDGHEALYCNVGAPEELADRLGLLIEQPGERARIGAAAAARMGEFTIARMTRRYNDILHRVTGAPTVADTRHIGAAPSPEATR